MLRMVGSQGVLGYNLTSVIEAIRPSQSGAPPRARCVLLAGASIGW